MAPNIDRKLVPLLVFIEENRLGGIVAEGALAAKAKEIKVALNISSKLLPSDVVMEEKRPGGIVAELELWANEPKVPLNIPLKSVTPLVLTFVKS